MVVTKNCPVDELATALHRSRDVHLLFLGLRRAVSVWTRSRVVTAPCSLTQMCHRIDGEMVSVPAAHFQRSQRVRLVGGLAS